jgi:hypothetical protein
MADQDRNEKSANLDASSSSNQSPDRSQTTRDPEFEMPDPEQVEKDREQAEETYGSKKPSSTGNPKKPKDDVA